eukprot:1195510-Prorocentrum_minimum.AAC.9
MCLLLVFSTTRRVFAKVKGRRSHNISLDRWGILLVLVLWAVATFIMFGQLGPGEGAAAVAPLSAKEQRVIKEDERAAAAEVARQRIAQLEAQSNVFAKTYERNLDELAIRVFRKEKSRLDADRRQRMEQERWKEKVRHLRGPSTPANKPQYLRTIRGKIRKLKIPRELEEEELQLFTGQHDNEMKRLAHILGAVDNQLAAHFLSVKWNCDNAESCATVTEKLVKDAVATARRSANRLFATAPDIIENAKAVFG